MRLIYVDDEKNSLLNFEYEIKDMEFVRSCQFFLYAKEALDYAFEHPIDVAFLDMEISDVKGADLALKLKKIQPNIVIIYITAYTQYALEAYRTGGRAYLLKPYTSEDIYEVFSFLKLIFKKNIALERPERAELIKSNKIFIKTFGSFDIFIDGKPIVFKNAKSKELLALLVDKKGGILTNVEIFNYLWEQSEYNKVTATYVRKVIQALKNLLLEHNCSDLVSFNRNSTNLNSNLYSSGYFECDYYSIFENEKKYINDYSGHYMSQYSWAEESIYILENKIKQLIK